jgi:cytochrome c biogenesis protein CcmG/thiol:disulfide interchange protein DsbE
MLKALLAAVLVCVAAQDSKFGNSYLGTAPPEIVSTKDQWFNAADGLTLAALKGKVVWLEFGFLKCAPCRKMFPVMQKWHTELGPKGLVVIDIDDGGIDDLDEVKKEVADQKSTYAVLWDKDSKNCQKYGVQVFPRAYLIGVDGKVIWEGLPNEKLAEIETLMAAEFAKVKK